MPIIGLEKILARIKPGVRLQGLSESIGRALIVEIQLEFQSSRDPYGRPWAPITHRSGQPLLDTGRLRNSFTFSASENSVALGTNVKYAAVHQFGGSRTVAARVRTNFYNRKGNRFSSKRFKNQRSWTGTIPAHQIGITARPMLPTESRGIGSKWSAAIDAVAKKWMRKNFG